MRLILLNDKIVDKELAMSIYSSNGVIYAKKGMKLTERNIKILKNIGIDTVYIKDENEEINVKEMIKTPVKLEIANDLNDVFCKIKKDVFIDESTIIDIANKLIKNIDLSENSFLQNNIGKKDTDSKLIAHSINTAILSLIVGINKKYDREKLEKLVVGALLHDVGKLFDEGKGHAKKGYDLIKNHSRLPITSYMCIFHHHEYEDGTGYPDNIKGDKVHEFGKIVCICNEYDNLLNSDKFNLPSEILEYMNSQSGNKYNKEIFDLFTESIYCYPNGLYVRLNNGEEGVVVLQNKNFPSRPMVGVVKNEVPVIYNLIENLTLFIEEIIL